MPFRGRKKAFDHRLGDAGLDVGSLDQSLYLSFQFRWFVPVADGVGCCGQTID